ncbi:MAG: hypothetical protein R3B54_15215 [Bdellovibrionota bacterium]
MTIACWFPNYELPAHRSKKQQNGDAHYDQKRLSRNHVEYLEAGHRYPRRDRLEIILHTVELTHHHADPALISLFGNDENERSSVNPHKPKNPNTALSRSHEGGTSQRRILNAARRHHSFSLWFISRIEATRIVLVQWFKFGHISVLSRLSEICEGNSLGKR